MIRIQTEPNLPDFFSEVESLEKEVIEMKLNAADLAAERDSRRYEASEVFERARKRINEDSPH